MPSYNNITLIGHLGKDPDIRYTPQGMAVCSFTMAVNDRKKVDGEWKDFPLWFKVTTWGKLAENSSQFLLKGNPCLVNGRLSIEQWTNKDGVNQTTLTVNANDVKFLSEKQTDNRPPRASMAPPKPTPQPEISDDDIPF